MKLVFGVLVAIDVSLVVRLDIILDMSTASPKEMDYFRRVASQNRALAQEQPPASLADMFERLNLLRSQLGPLAEPGRTGPADGDLASHLAYLERLRSVDNPRRA